MSRSSTFRRRLLAIVSVFTTTVLTVAGWGFAPASFATDSDEGPAAGIPPVRISDDIDNTDATTNALDSLAQQPGEDADVPDSQTQHSGEDGDATAPQQSSSGTTVDLAPVDIPAGHPAVIGVTWTGSARVSVQVQLLRDGKWQDAEHIDMEAPQRNGRQGITPTVVTDAQKVRARLISNKEQPVTDPQLHVINSQMTQADQWVSGQLRSRAVATDTSTVIHTRNEWGANPAYMTWPTEYTLGIRGAVIHHTVGSNNYSKADVPGIIRDIYYYHAVTLGWGDIGYNVLVDKFGNAWEGRAGGLTRDPIGAHAIGSNSYTFGISVLGTFTSVQPSNEAVAAVSNIVAWKFRLRGLKAAAPMSIPGKGTISSNIVGHRDVFATACPGEMFYRYTLPRIRTNVARILSNTAPSVPPATPTNPSSYTNIGTQVGRGFPASATYDAGDFNSDGVRDTLLVRPDGRLTLFNHKNSAAVPTARDIGRGWGGFEDLMTGIDFDGDGHPDVLARTQDGRLLLYPGNGRGGFRPSRQVGTGWHNFARTFAVEHGVGKRPTVLGLYPNGTLRAYPTDGSGRFTSAIANFPGDYSNLAGDPAVAYTSRPMQRPARGTGLSGAFPIGDLNRDGFDDLAQRDERGIKVRLASATGFTALPSAPTVAVSSSYARGNRVLGTGSGVTRLSSSAKQDVFAVVDGLRELRIFTRTIGTPPVSSPNSWALRWGESMPIGRGFPTQTFAMGGFSGNGYTDAAFVDARGNLKLLQARSRTSFTSARQIGSGWNTVKHIMTGVDFDGDGTPDVMAVNRAGDLMLYPGNRAGGFKPTRRIGTGWQGFVRLFAFQDAAGGHPAIGALDKTGRLRLYITRGGAQFTSPLNLGVGFNHLKDAFAVSDLNQDGYSDLLFRDGAGQLFIQSVASGTAKQPRVTGRGWGGFTALMSANLDDIWARTPAGQLVRYQTLGPVR